MNGAATILWFRRDLRTGDHPALAAAAASGPVLGAFVGDPTLLAPAGPSRVAHLVASVRALDASIGGRLVVRTGPPEAVLAALAEEVVARRVVATADFGPAGRARDERVTRALGARGIALELLDSPYAVAPGTVRTRAGEPCRVFSAYLRGWSSLEKGRAGAAPAVDWLGAPSEDPAGLLPLAGSQRPDYFADLPDDPPELAPAGETAAQAALEAFAERAEIYSETRDLPGLAGTSRLSAHLKVGAIHPRTVLEAVGGASDSFLAEIAWREFYADVLFHDPASARAPWRGTSRPLRVDRDARARERFVAWARGETGYPLVDAGMRQLRREGWMHNRVRMVCASFLVKHLHLDWRWGARWFLWRLVDGDLASNQHGWQWVAGTGTDAAPFHRVFNPVTQAERFDPEGRYVRRYVDELAHLEAPDCLRPVGGGLLAPGYPAPIVELDVERREALARHAEARGRA